MKFDDEDGWKPGTIGSIITAGDGTLRARVKLRDDGGVRAVNVGELQHANKNAWSSGSGWDIEDGSCPLHESIKISTTVRFTLYFCVRYMRSAVTAQ